MERQRASKVGMHKRTPPAGAPARATRVGGFARVKVGMRCLRLPMSVLAIVRTPFTPSGFARYLSATSERFNERRGGAMPFKLYSPRDNAVRTTNLVASLILPCSLLAPVVTHAAEPAWLRELFEPHPNPGVESDLSAALSSTSLAKDSSIIAARTKSDPKYLSVYLSQIPDREIREHVALAVPHLTRDDLVPVIQRELQ